MQNVVHSDLNTISMCQVQVNPLQKGYRISDHLLKMAVSSYVSVVIDVVSIPMLSNTMGSSQQILKKIILIYLQDVCN